MGNKLPALALATAAAVAGFFALRDNSPPTKAPDSPVPASHSGPDGFAAPGNAQASAVAGVARASAGPAELQEAYALISENPDYPRLQMRLDAMRKRRPGRSFEASQVVETMAQGEAWARIETPPETLPLSPAEKSDGREFIRFDPLRIETLMPGDTLEIPIWQQGARYKMRVESSEVHANGSVTWHGQLENFNEPHRVVLTVGDGLSLGGIETPGGHYVLQAHGDAGWIASSETLFKRDENETDMIIPPEEELESH